MEPHKYNLTARELLQERANINNIGSSFKKFLDLIQAPDDMLYIGLLVKSFRRIIKNCLNSNPDRNWLLKMTTIDCQTLSTILDFIDGESHSVTNKVTIKYMPDVSTNRHPYHGRGIDERPVYAALMQQPEKSEKNHWQKIFSFTQMIYWGNFCSIDSQKHSKSLSWLNYYNRILLDAGRRIRQNARETHWIASDSTKINLAALENDSTFTEWRHSLRSITGIKDDLTRAVLLVTGATEKNVYKGTKNKIRFFTKAINIRKKPSGFWESNDFFYDDLFINEPGFPILPLRTTIRAATGKNDLPHDHRTMTRSGREFVLIDEDVASIKDDAENFKLPSFKTDHVAAVIMSRQNLPGKPSELHPIQIKPLLDWISTRNPNGPDYLLSCLISAMLWTGMSKPEIDNIQLINSSNKIRIPGSNYCIEDEGLIDLYCEPPAWKNLKLSNQALHSTERVEIPDVNSAVAMYLKERPKSKTVSKTVINKKLNEIDSLKYINIRRLTNSLYYYALSRRICDISHATYLFSRSIDGLAEIHYTAISSNYAQQLYKRTCTLFLADCGYNEKDIKGFFPVLTEPINSTTLNHIGSRTAPDMEYMTNLVKDTRQSMIESSRTEKKSDLVRFHNAITLYTWIGFAIAVGARAISDPLPRRSNIIKIEDRNYVILREKGGSYNNRLCYLSQVIVDQFDIYYDHLHHFYAELMADSRLNRHERLLAGTPVLIGENIDPNAMSPASIKNSFDGELLLPVNTTRVQFRSHLIRATNLYESINYAMGHWRSGQEPFGIYSSLSLIESVEPLISAIDALVETLQYISQCRQ